MSTKISGRGVGPRRSPRWEGFEVYESGDDTFQIIVVSGGGGYTFAAGFNSRGEAEWAARLFNAAIGSRWVPGAIGGVRAAETAKAD